MNKTRKLRGGDVLTQIERARLASIKSNTISGKVRDMLDYLKALTQSGKKEFDSELNKKLTTLINSSYTEYIDIFKDLYQVTDPIQVKTAKELLLLEKHFNNVKVLVQTLLTSINQSKKLENKEAELTRIKSQAQAAPEEPIPQVAHQELEIGNARIIDNLLAEIDILKSEIFSKDIMIEEQNKELVTAFYLLSNNENALSITSSSSVNSGSSKPDDAEIAALRQTIQKQEAEHAELEQLRKTTGEQEAEIARHISTIERQLVTISSEAGKTAGQQQTIETNTRRINELEAEVAGKQKSIENLEEQLRNIGEENRKLKAELGEKNATIAGLETRLAVPLVPPANLNEEQIKELKTNNAKLFAENGELNRQNQELINSNADLIRNLGTATGNIAEFEGKLQAETKKVEELEGELADEKGRNTALGAELAAAKISIADLETRLGVATKRIQSLEGDLGVARQRVQSLEGELGVSMQRIQELEGDLGVARQSIQSLEGQLGGLKAVSVATDATLEQRISELTAEKTKLERTLSEQTEYVKQLDIRFHQATNRIAELEAEVGTPFNEASINSILSAKPKEIDHALILRHTLFNDLKGLIENIKKTTKYDIKTIISSLNDIIASCNDLYNSRIPLLTEPSTITQINQKIKEIYTIIKNKNI